MYARTVLKKLKVSGRLLGVYGAFGQPFENKGSLGYQSSHESPASIGGSSSRLWKLDTTQVRKCRWTNSTGTTTGSARRRLKLRHKWKDAWKNSFPFPRQSKRSKRLVNVANRWARRWANRSNLAHHEGIGNNRHKQCWRRQIKTARRLWVCCNSLIELLAWRRGFW